MNTIFVGLFFLIDRIGSTAFYSYCRHDLEIVLSNAARESDFSADQSEVQ